MAGEWEGVGDNSAYPMLLAVHLQISFENCFAMWQHNCNLFALQATAHQFFNKHLSVRVGVCGERVCVA